MNDDVSKSFHCNEIGCQMSFYTEQNLSAHRQVKHNKLNLEIPSKDATINFSADQTPTPTRLLNKCEELRVFDDPYIQNLNPFDEGFRKAISDDHQQSGFLATPSSNQDTLHTPQIIPEFISRIVKDENSLLPVQDEPENLSTTPDIPKYTVTDHHAAEKSQQPIPLLPKPNIFYAAPILTATSMHLSSSSDSNSSNNEKRPSESVKDKLKNILLSNNNNNNNNNNSNGTGIDGTKRLKIDPEAKLNLPTILIQTVPLIAPANLIINNSNTDNSSLRVTTRSNSDNSNSGTKLKAQQTKKTERETSTKKRSATTNSDNNTSNNSAALKVERNRAAARRYRHKMKIQSQALREKYERSQKEIAQLKKEVTELKKLLLLHKDCEVTKRLSLMN